MKLTLSRHLLVLGLFLLGILGILASGGGGGGSDSSSSNSGTASIAFGAQAQNVNFSSGVPRDFSTVDTFDVVAEGGPFESVTVDTSAILNNLTLAVMRPVLPTAGQIANNYAYKTDTIGPDTPAVSSCFPFGIGPLGNPGITDPWGPYGAFVYQNVPAFDLQVGDGIAFDLGQPNDVDIGLDIYLAATTTNGGNLVSGMFTKIVSNSQKATSPRGDAIVGNYELGFTAENAFTFPGGGLIIRFENPSAEYNADTTCDEVLINADQGDTSGYFLSRIMRDADGTSPWDEEFTTEIGAFRIGTGAPTVAATVQVNTGLAEEQDDLCNAGTNAISMQVFIDGINRTSSVQPSSFNASQAVVDIINSGSVATCTRVTPNVDATASVSGADAEYKTCEDPPGDFDGQWSGTYSCTGSCPDPGGPITLSVNQDGETATYSDGSASYSGTICGDVFSFRGGNMSYDESGKLTLTGPDSATKTSFFRSSAFCSGRCTDILTRD